MLGFSAPNNKILNHGNAPFLENPDCSVPKGRCWSMCAEDQNKKQVIVLRIRGECELMIEFRCPKVQNGIDLLTSLESKVGDLRDWPETFHRSINYEHRSTHSDGSQFTLVERI